MEEICGNSKQQLQAAGITAINRCPCEFTNESGKIVTCGRPFADHRDETYPQGKIIFELLISYMNCFINNSIFQKVAAVLEQIVKLHYSDSVNH